MYDTYIINVAELIRSVIKVSFRLKKPAIIIISSFAIMIAIGLSIDMYLTHKEIMDAANACYNLNGNPIVHKEGLITSNWSFTCNDL